MGGHYPSPPPPHSRQSLSGLNFSAEGIKALDSGHPVVADYLLEAAQAGMTEADAPAAARQAWEAMLLHLAESSPDRGTQMQPMHYRAARAVTLLADHGSEESLAQVARLLAGRYGPRVRAAAAGLLRAKDKRVCDLARPLLQSPYEELVTDAALTLGRFGDQAVGPYFERILVRRADAPAPLVTLAAWYTLKVAGLDIQAARTLAQAAK
jgi:hypothetical protein